MMKCEGGEGVCVCVCVWGGTGGGGTWGGGGGGGGGRGRGGGTRLLWKWMFRMLSSAFVTGLSPVCYFDLLLSCIEVRTYEYQTIMMHKTRKMPLRHMSCNVRKRTFGHVRPAFAQSDQNVHWRFLDSQGRKVSSGEQRRIWSDCVYAQVDFVLPWFGSYGVQMSLLTVAVWLGLRRRLTESMGNVENINVSGKAPIRQHGCADWFGLAVSMCLQGIFTTSCFMFVVFTSNTQLGCVKRKSASSGPLLFIETFYSIQYFCLRTAKTLIRLRMMRSLISAFAVRSHLIGAFAVARKHVFAWRG